MTAKVNDIGQRIAKKRGELGMRLEDLAQKAGITREELSCYEEGRASLSIETALSICAGLGVSAGQLTGTDCFGDCPGDRLSDDEAALLGTVRGLPAEERSRMEEWLRENRNK